MNTFQDDEDKLREECGVFGIYGGENTSESCYYGLYALQHRGQESAGIAVSDKGNVQVYREGGLVSEVFTPTILDQLRGNIGVGHVRYAVEGSALAINYQPLVIRYRKGALALAQNGSLVNKNALRRQLEEEGAVFQTTGNTEVMANLIARMHQDNELEDAVVKMMSTVKGSYALVMLSENKLIGLRDPLGIRPLVLGRIGEHGYVLASESCAFDAVGAEMIRDVKPGEIVIIDENGFRSIQTPTPLQSGLCVFEFVYLARTDSVIDGISVYAARYAAGKRLAQLEPVDADMVVGVPDSATPAAMGYAEQSGIPYGEGLTKNRYVGRTFIQPEQGLRELAVRIKLNALTRNIRGKRIVLVDDSIVRGTTSKKIVDMLRMAGAREVHMRISSPPVKHPCYFGIDTPDVDQLLANKYDTDAMRRLIGADSLAFLPAEELLRTVEGSGCQFCVGCFNGQYPMPIEQEGAIT